MDFFNKLFDDEFTWNDVYRILALFGALALVILILQPFRAENAAIELRLNPLYSTVMDSTVSHEARSIAVDKLTSLEIQKRATNYWQTILETCITLFVLTIVASVIAYGFTKWKWSTPFKSLYENGMQETEPKEIVEAKIYSVVGIFIAVLLSGSLFIIAKSILMVKAL